MGPSRVANQTTYKTRTGLYYCQGLVFRSGKRSRSGSGRLACYKLNLTQCQKSGQGLTQTHGRIDTLKREIWRRSWRVRSTEASSHGKLPFIKIDWIVCKHNESKSQIPLATHILAAIHPGLPFRILFLQEHLKSRKEHVLGKCAGSIPRKTNSAQIHLSANHPVVIILSPASLSNKATEASQTRKTRKKYLPHP